MNYTYKAYYTILIEVPINRAKDRDMVITAPTPIRALDIFHKNIQTMKPALKPEDYKVTSFVQRYRSETEKNVWIESAVDLPSSPNPDVLAKVVREPILQSEMPLDDARKEPERKYEQADKTV